MTRFELFYFYRYLVAGVINVNSFEGFVKVLFESNVSFVSWKCYETLCKISILRKFQYVATIPLCPRCGLILSCGLWQEISEFCSKNSGFYFISQTDGCILWEKNTISNIMNHKKVIEEDYILEDSLELLGN